MPKQDTRVGTADLWVMLLSTIRYSMGRSTYMPSYCAELYERFKKFLETHHRHQIAREIEEELRLAQSRGHYLGGHVDHITWTALAEKIRKELLEEEIAK